MISEGGQLAALGALRPDNAHRFLDQGMPNSSPGGDKSSVVESRRSGAPDVLEVAPMDQIA
jgi:hypothetical protein